MKKVLILIISFGIQSSQLWAANSEKTNQATNKYSVYQDPVFYGLILIALVLLLYIFQLQSVLVGIAQKTKKEKKKNSNWPKGAAMIAFLIGTSSQIFAQSNAVNAPLEPAQEATPVLDFLHEGFGSLEMNMLFLLVIIEILVVMYYSRMIVYLTKEQEKMSWEFDPRTIEEVKTNRTSAFWDKVNKSIDIEEELSVMTDHEYDGIRELDNALPPWWKYGFYLTIVWALVYLVHYHVAATGPSSQKEYEIQVAEAEKQIEEYRKNAKNLVDEKTVVLLTNPSDIENGKNIFNTNCTSCHGNSGEGKIGPNLTDNFWKHGGTVNDLFKTVKLGVSGTGMKAWKSDLSAMEIAQVSSYILTLKGTNPANAKAPEGLLIE
jgi:cytochrome c oxidase cbb3-type subunit 3